MKDIQLNKTQFLEFNYDDQFGFFYNEDGYPTEDADDEFEDNVKELYNTYDYILVTPKDTIYGIKSDKKELLMKWADESYSIAIEVLEDFP
jgi:hypothetical protein